MRVEQACRYRTDTGYRDAAATSPGFDSSMAGDLAKIFNDVMSPAVKLAGGRALTCAIGRDHVFYALTTERSDGRGYLFTHAYAIPLADYVHLMDDAPETLLRHSLSSMYDNRPPDEALPTAEVTPPEGVPLTLAELRKRYELDSAFFAEVLQFSAIAAARGTSICFRTTREQAEAENIVRELFFCILKSLPQVYWRRLSFSSVKDTRMSICMNAGPNDAPGKVRKTFSLDPDGRKATGGNSDSLLSRAYSKLAELEGEEQHRVLTNLQYLLTNLLADEGDIPTERETAFGIFQISGMEFSEQELDGVLSLLGDPSRRIRYRKDTLDRVMTWLADTYVKQHRCPDQHLSLLLDYCLKSGGDEFAEKFLSLLEYASEDALCAALPDVLQAEESVRRQALQSVFLPRIAWSEQTRQEAAKHLASWATEQDELLCIDAVSEALCSAAKAQQDTVLVDRILDETGEKELTRCGRELLNPLLGILMEHGIHLDEKYAALLDYHTGLCEDRDPLLETWTAYTEDIRLSEDNADRVKLLQHLKGEKTASLFVALEKSESRNQALWDEFYTTQYLQSGMTYAELKVVCEEHHRDPDTWDAESAFEQRGVELWKEIVSSDSIWISSSDSTVVEKAKKLKDKMEQAKELLEQIDALCLSDQSRLQMAKETARQLLNQVKHSEVIIGVRTLRNPQARERYDDLYQLFEVLSASGQDRKTSTKWKLWRAVDALEEDEPNSKTLVELYKKNPQIFFKGTIQDAFYGLVKRRLKVDSIMLWDPLLLSCSTVKKNGNYVDSDFSFNSSTISNRIQLLEDEFEEALWNHPPKHPHDCMVLTQKETVRRALEKAAKKQNRSILLDQFRASGHSKSSVAKRNPLGWILSWILRK